MLSLHEDFSYIGIHCVGIYFFFHIMATFYFMNYLREIFNYPSLSMRCFSDYFAHLQVTDFVSTSVSRHPFVP